MQVKTERNLRERIAELESLLKAHDIDVPPYRPSQPPDPVYRLGGLSFTRADMGYMRRADREEIEGLLRFVD